MMISLFQFNGGSPVGAAALAPPVGLTVGRRRQVAASERRADPALLRMSTSGPRRRSFKHTCIFVADSNSTPKMSNQGTLCNARLRDNRWPQCGNRVFLVVIRVTC